MKSFLKTKAGKILMFVLSTAVIVTVAVVMLQQKEEAYRTIVVEEVNGTAVVTNGTSKTDAYANMALFSGNQVKVQSESNLTLVLDSDKHMLAEAGTRFVLEASGSPGSGKTAIHMQEGSMLIRIENKLSDDESYEVNTPSSVISVRGTVFYITIGLNEEGESLVCCSTFDGTIEVQPVDKDGNPTQEPALVPAGKSVGIEKVGPSSDYIRDENGDTYIMDIEYTELPAEILKELIEYVNDNEELIVDEAFLEELLQSGEHQHSFAEEWSYDDNGHWHNAACEHDMEREDEGPHEWDAGAVILEATETSTGNIRYVCKVCGDTRNETIAKLHAHKWGNWTADEIANVHSRSCACGETESISHRWNNGTVTTEATHLTEGVNTFTCTDCRYTRTESVMKLTDHTWSEWKAEEDNGDYHFRSCECGDTYREKHTLKGDATCQMASICVCGLQYKPDHSMRQFNDETQHWFQCIWCDMTSMAEEHVWSDWVAEDGDGCRFIRTCECIIVQYQEHMFGVLQGEDRKPTFWQDGEIAYYECSECGSLEDRNHNPIDTYTIPKLSTDLSVSVNGECTPFTLLIDNGGYLCWTIYQIALSEGDQIVICDSNDQSILYEYIVFTSDYYPFNIADSTGNMLYDAKAGSIMLICEKGTFNLIVLGDGYLYDCTNKTYTCLTAQEDNTFLIENYVATAGAEFVMYGTDEIQLSPFVFTLSDDFDTSIGTLVDKYNFKFAKSGVFNITLDITTSVLTIEETVVYKSSESEHSNQ